MSPAAQPRGPYACAAAVLAAYTALGEAKVALLVACARHDARMPDRAQTGAEVEAAAAAVGAAQARIWFAEGFIRPGAAHGAPAGACVCGNRPCRVAYAPVRQSGETCDEERVHEDGGTVCR